MEASHNPEVLHLTLSCPDMDILSSVVIHPDSILIILPLYFIRAFILAFPSVFLRNTAVPVSWPETICSILLLELHSTVAPTGRLSTV